MNQQETPNGELHGTLSVTEQRDMAVGALKDIQWKLDEFWSGSNPQPMLVLSGLRQFVDATLLLIEQFGEKA